MKITPLKTQKVLPHSIDIRSFLDKELGTFHENNILVVTSKVVSLCEKRSLSKSSGDEAKLVVEESDRYIKETRGDFTYFITIAYHTLILTAGVDGSNSNGHFVLLPQDPQKSANDIRHYLCDRFGLKEIGVIIVDSTSQPLRRGTIGVALAHSGFRAVHDYRGKPDIFGHILRVSQSNVVGGLAAAAVVTMGEGAEQKPLCLLSDLPFVKFQSHDPSPLELKHLYVEPDNDLFAPFLSSVDWQKGKRGS